MGFPHPRPNKSLRLGTHKQGSGERGALFLDISSIPAQDTPSPSPPPQQPLDLFFYLSLFLSLTRSHPAHTRLSADGCTRAAAIQLPGSGGGTGDPRPLRPHRRLLESSARRPGCLCVLLLRDPKPSKCMRRASGIRKSPEELPRRGVQSLLGAWLVSGSSVRSVKSHRAARGPPSLRTPYRARAQGPTPLDFSVVRAGWGRGEGREVTSLSSLSTTKTMPHSSTAQPWSKSLGWVFV